MSNPPTRIGRYEVLEPIGRGGMGSLYLALDPLLDRQIAIKLLRDDDDELRERFAREARAAARLRHPNIVTIFDVGEHDGQPFIAMEYIQGQTLAEIVRGNVPLTLTRKLELIEALCDGLGFAHRSGIVHRDIKPANLMIDADGSLKILDFGIARAAESSGMTQAGMLIGTLNYMSPEQVSGQPVDARSDLFAVGAVFYELLTYRQAFPGGLMAGVLNRILSGQPDPITSIVPDLDPDIVAIVERALQKEPDHRYQDLGAMRQDIAAVRSRLTLSGQAATVVVPPPAAVPGDAPSRPSSSARRAADLEEIGRRRNEQIQRHLSEAESRLAAGEAEAAIALAEQALLLDTGHAKAHEVIERARAMVEARQLDEALEAAAGGLASGDLAAAGEHLARAAGIDPDAPRVQTLRRSLDDAIEREEAARQKEALDARAREAVDEAQRRFAAGGREEALALLAGFVPPHPLVARTLERLRAEAARHAEKERAEAERAEHERAERERERERLERERLAREREEQAARERQAAEEKARAARQKIASPDGGVDADDPTVLIVRDAPASEAAAGCDDAQAKQKEEEPPPVEPSKVSAPTPAASESAKSMAAAAQRVGPRPGAAPATGKKEAAGVAAAPTSGIDASRGNAVRYGGAAAAGVVLVAALGFVFSGGSPDEAVPVDSGTASIAATDADVSGPSLEAAAGSEGDSGAAGVDAGNPPAPADSPAAAAQASPPPQAPATQQPAAAPPPPPAPSTTAAGADTQLQRELDRLFGDASSQWATGNRQAALKTVESALGRRPGDERFTGLASQMRGDAQRRAETARNSAREAGAAATALDAYGNGENLLGQAVRESSAIDAARAFLAAEAQFAAAAGEGRKLAAAARERELEQQRQAEAKEASAENARAADEQAIRDVVERYRQAYNTLNADAVSAVFPSAPVAALRRTFSSFESQTVTFSNVSVTLDDAGTAATVRAQVRTVVKPRGASEQTSNSSMTLTLQKKGSWIITARQ